jgi:hypothetical protein
MLSRATLLLGLVLLVGCEPTNQGYEPLQPIAYSHAVHAGASEIPCQYCHFGVQRGRYAGIPPATVCMNCHEQVKKDNGEVVKVRTAIESDEPIAWVRVHRLPDHAFFDHSAHVVSAEIECLECHGSVEFMGRVQQWSSLTMGWCLDCHRQGTGDGDDGVPANVINRLTDCSVCHH